MYQNWQDKQFHQFFSFYRSFVPFFLTNFPTFFLLVWSKATGELLMREGIFVLLLISHCYEKSLRNKASMKYQTFLIFSEIQLPSRNLCALELANISMSVCVCGLIFPYKYSFFISLHTPPAENESAIVRPFSPSPHFGPSDHQVNLHSVSCAMAQRKWAAKTEYRQKHHRGPNALLCQILQIPCTRVGGKSDLHNYRPEKNTNGPVLLSSTPSIPLSLSLPV